LSDSASFSYQNASRETILSGRREKVLMAYYGLVLMLNAIARKRGRFGQVAALTNLVTDTDGEQISPGDCDAAKLKAD
jgi:hypothetical protein